MATKSEIDVILKLRDEVSKNAQKVSGSLRNLDAAAKKNATSLGGLQLKHIAVGAAMLQLARLAKDSIAANAAQERAVNSLNLALSNQGNLLPGTSKRLQEYASSLQRVTTFGDEQILQAQALLAGFGQNEEQLKATTKVALDFATATGRDVTAAVNLLGKAFVGETGELSRYGIIIDKNIPKSEKFSAVIKQMTERFGGAAQVATQDFTGQLEQVKNAAGDTLEELGKLIAFLASDFTNGATKATSGFELLGHFLGDVLPTAISEVRAQFAELLGSIFDLTAGLAEFGGKIPGLELFADIPDPAILRAMADGQRDLARETRESADAFVAGSDGSEKFTNNLKGTADVADGTAKSAKDLAKELAELNKEVDILSTQAFTFDQLIPPGVVEDVKIMSREFEGFRLILPGTKEGLDSFGQPIEDLKTGIEAAEDAQKQYNAALAAANDIAQLLGGTIGQIVGQTAAAGAALQNLSSGPGGLLGGLKGSFSAGKGDAGGITGLLGGIGGLAAAAGPLIGLGTTLVKGLIKALKGGANLVRDAARDMGATITKEMAESIKKSGKPIQLAVADIFEAGGFDSVDRFAEEVGDLFSAFEQGSISNPELVTALEQSVPLLLANLKELGPTGEAEIQRIIGAAREMGVEFEGLGDLINSTFAPQTLEDMKESLGLTGEEVRALAERLGVDLQTNLERAAAAVGLTVAEFKALQEAAGGALGSDTAATMEELEALMAATGLSAQELAEKLNVDVAGGAESVAEGAAAGTTEINNAVDAAIRLKLELLGAATAAGQINIPGGGSLDSGGGIPHLAGGGIVRRPTLALIGEKGPEAVIPLGGGGGDAVSVLLGIKEELRQNRSIMEQMPRTFARSVRDEIRK